jgi:hypothetical protein
LGRPDLVKTAGGSGAGRRVLRELIRADVAEAEFIELTVGQLMESIYHVVVTAFKTAINPICFHDR